MTDNMAANLRRLLFFHHASAREAARVLGVNEHSVSSWLTGKRPPGGQALMAIDRRYGISPRDLDLDEVAFAQRLADPERLNYVRIGDRTEHVVPIRGRKRQDATRAAARMTAKAGSDPRDEEPEPRTRKRERSKTK